MILVTGASGRLGSRTVRLLRAARMEVRALVRPGSEYFWLNDTGCDYFFGDLRDRQSIRRAARGCDYVIHCAGVGVESTDNHHGNVTRQGAMDLVDAAVDRGVKHLVFFSSVSVDGSTNAWTTALRDAEAHLIASGLSHTILRCAPFMEDLCALAEAESPRMWCAPETPHALLSRQDAALHGLASLDLQAAHNAVWEIGGPEVLPVGDAVERVFRALGSDAQVTWVHGWRAKAAAQLARPAGRRWTHWVDRQAGMWGRAHAIDTDAQQAAFGLPLTSLDDAVAAWSAQPRLGQDPDDRNERVVHRQFQATVYAPGKTPWAELPDGPQRADDD